MGTTWRRWKCIGLGSAWEAEKGGHDRGTYLYPPTIAVHPREPKFKVDIIFMKNMVDHQRWFNVESTLKTNQSSTLIQRWINVDQPNISWEKGWSSTLIQRWINVDDQPYFPWKLRLILNVDSTLNQRWESTLISKWLKNGWNLVEFWFSWRMVDDQRWFNVEILTRAHWVVGALYINGKGTPLAFI